MLLSSDHSVYPRAADECNGCLAAASTCSVERSLAPGRGRHKRGGSPVCWRYLVLRERWLESQVTRLKRRTCKHHTLITVALLVGLCDCGSLVHLTDFPSLCQGCIHTCLSPSPCIMFLLTLRFSLILLFTSLHFYAPLPFCSLVPVSLPLLSFFTSMLHFLRFLSRRWRFPRRNVELSVRSLTAFRRATRRFRNP